MVHPLEDYLNRFSEVLPEEIDRVSHCPGVCIPGYPHAPSPPPQ